MRTERFVPLVATLLLVVGILSTVYVQSLQENIKGDFIKINGKEITLDEIQKSCNEKEINTSSGETYTGISLSEIINLSGVKNPDLHKFKIIGADGYSKTVGWNYMENGVFSVNKKMTIFQDLPKQFWVKDVVEIKVI